MKRIGWISAIAVLLALSAFAYGLLSGRSQPSAETPASSSGERAPDARPAEPGETASTQAFREAKDRMQRETFGYSGDADVDFLREMIAHDEAAVAMAKIAVEHGEAADVQSLAREIISAQEAEIVRMRILLARHQDAPGAAAAP